MAENSNINPSPFNNNSSSAKGAVITDCPKKRKFEEDQLEAPLPNHKTFERILVSTGCDTSLKQESDTCMINEDAESERDSNSFVADPDPWESEPGFSTTSVREKPSTTNWGSSSFESTLYSLDSRILTNTVRGKEAATAPVLDQSLGHGNIHFEEYPEFDEELLALEGLVDYSYAEYLNKCTSKEDTEEMPSSSGANQNVYVLSSGRWSVNPEPLLETKKPTIDQEFEEYFSSLMLFLAFTISAVLFFYNLIYEWAFSHISVAEIEIASETMSQPQSETSYEILEPQLGQVLYKRYSLATETLKLSPYHANKMKWRCSVQVPFIPGNACVLLNKLGRSI